MKTKTGINPLDPDWLQECGPLRPLLKDNTISEIMINRFDRIFVERNGVLQESELKFDSVDALTRAVQSIVVSIGKEVNRRTPYLDARLLDGSRLNLIVPPIAVEGPSITIRKFSAQTLNYKILLQNGMINDKLLYFLMQAVRSRLNIVVSGGTGSGKTTFLNFLSSLILPNERVITIEDTAELQLTNKNIVRMESKMPMLAEPGVSIQDLVRNALRMRPDRLVIGECRGDEAWDMLMAMNTGHDGSMTTMHANSAMDSLRRLEAMILRSGLEAPLPMIKEDISRTINMIVQVERSSDGQRRVVEVVEVTGRDEFGYQAQEIFKYDHEMGLVSTGTIPQFVVHNQNPKIQFSEEFFNPQHKVKLAG